MKTLITPEECIRFAEKWEDPMESCIRIVLRRGTFYDLYPWDVADDSGLAALTERVLTEGTVSETDRERLTEYLAPILRQEWEMGHFDIFWSSEEPGYQLLVQCFPGENIDALSGVFNCWFGGEEELETIMSYREADSFAPEIVKVLVGPSER